MGLEMCLAIGVGLIFSFLLFSISRPFHASYSIKGPKLMTTDLRLPLLVLSLSCLKVNSRLALNLIPMLDYNGWATSNVLPASSDVNRSSNLQSIIVSHVVFMQSVILVSLRVQCHSSIHDYEKRFPTIHESVMSGID
jgi:hypothetical protein